MNRILLALFAVGLLTFSACTNTEGDFLAGGLWHFKGSSYTVSSAIGSSTASSMTAITGMPGDSMILRFVSYPRYSGNYTITSSAHPAAGQVYLYVVSADKGYVAKEGLKKAVVTVNAGRLTVLVPSIQLFSPANSSDSSAFAAQVTENI